MKLLSLVILIGSAVAWAQPRAPEDADGPGRGVARISVINGDVSVRRGDSGDLVAAAINAPLVAQDRVFTGPASRAEVQFDYANIIRIGSDSEIRLSELENRRYQIQVARGIVTYRVLRQSDADVEVSTPTVSVRPSRQGSYRIMVREDGQTEVTARSGEVEIFSPRGVEVVRAGSTMLVRGTASDPEFQMVRALDRDEWDNWNDRRDQDMQRSVSYRYVPHDVYGAEDLDPYGQWNYEAPYGYVWVPRVAVGWAPYRTGRWVWEDWYGWTWVSYDPWGWAPFHYGRWYWGSRGWSWWPGGLYERHYWRPALVAFFGFGGYGGTQVGFGFGNVGWVPLAPYEVYRPWYGSRYYGGYRSGGYVNNSINVTNVNITNVYRNARVRDGVTGVGVGDFSSGRFHNYTRIPSEQISRAGLVQGQVPVAPTSHSLRLSDREARLTGVQARDNQQFFSRRQPAAVERVPFEQQRRSMDQMTRHDASASVAQSSQGSGVVSRGDGGWRRFGNASPDQQTSRGTFTSPMQHQSSAADTSHGWRRFGDPTATGTAPVSRGAERRPDNSGRRFGDTPSAGAAAPDHGNAPTHDANNGWRRFGSPGANPPGAAEAAPRRSGDPGRRQDFVDRGNWSRQADTPHYQPRFEGGSSGGRGGRSESIQIAPPVVRERPAMERHSGGASGGGSPRMGGDSVMRGGGGGGGGHAEHGGGGGAGAAQVSRGNGGGGHRGR